MLKGGYWAVGSAQSFRISTPLSAGTLKLLTFTTSYFQANAVIPYIIVAPYFFLGKITRGQMTQTAGLAGSSPRSHSLSRATSRWQLTRLWLNV